MIRVSMGADTFGLIILAALALGFLAGYVATGRRR